MQFFRAMSLSFIMVVGGGAAALWYLCLADRRRTRYAAARLRPSTAALNPNLAKFAKSHSHVDEPLALAGHPRRPELSFRLSRPGEGSDEAQSASGPAKSVNLTSLY